MGQPAAKSGDQIKASHKHYVQTSQGPVELPFSFSAEIDGRLSPDVMIEGRAAAVVGSTAANGSHKPDPGGTFQPTPTNTGDIQKGSTTVMINGQPAARHGDAALACGLSGATVEATGTSTVFIG